MSKKSPAAAAGLRDGDLIVAFEDRAIEGIDQLQTLLRDWPPGKPASLRILRRGAMVEQAIFPAEMDS